VSADDLAMAAEMRTAAEALHDSLARGVPLGDLAGALRFFADGAASLATKASGQEPPKVVLSIVGRIAERIRDAIDGARSAGAALAKSAHEVVDVAQPETTPTALGTSGRADLIDREVVRTLLTGAHLSRVDGMLSAYGTVLRMLDDAREEEHGAAVGRVEREAQNDVSTYRQALRDGETDAPEAWASAAFDAWIGDDPEAIDPLTTDEARAVYVAAFKRTIDQLLGDAG
jgi:hypothetical protein